MDNNLRKEERLYGFKKIEHLFKESGSFLIYPYKVVWNYNTDGPDKNFCFGVSVSKRNFKRAVDRNLLKRRTREAYRTNKHILYNRKDMLNSGYNFMLIYIGKEILPFAYIESKIILILRRLSGEDEKSLK